MPYKITVDTEDGNSYELTEVFKIREDAEARADEIMSGGAGNIDDSEITGCWVEKTKKKGGLNQVSSSFYPLRRDSSQKNFR